MEDNKTNNQVVASVVAPAAPSDYRRDENHGQRNFDNRRSFGRGGRPNRGPRQEHVKPEYEQKVLDIARVARVTKGGKRFSFRATIVIGDMKGRVSVGMAKGKDVAQSVQKAYNQAKKSLVKIPIVNGTIPYQVNAKYNSAVVVLKPAKGGVKAGGPVRVVAKLAGITSLTGKLTERTNNKINIAMATIKALQMLRIKELKK